MSSKKDCHHNHYATHHHHKKTKSLREKDEDDEIQSAFQQLSELIMNANSNNLNAFYGNNSNSYGIIGGGNEGNLFKKQIDQLNIAFYNETEKILGEGATKGNVVKCQDRLFVILFKQINLYIKEIERLNRIIIDEGVGFNDRLKPRISSSLNIKDNDANSIQTLKASIKALETKLVESKLNEAKYKEEIESLRLKLENESSKECTNDIGAISTFRFTETNQPNQTTVVTPTNNDQLTIGNIHVSYNPNANIPSTSISNLTTNPMNITSKPRKKRNNSDNNLPNPFANNIQRINIKGVHKSPFPNSANTNNIPIPNGNANNKKPAVTNFKIIKSIKQKLKEEDGNSKINSPRNNQTNSGHSIEKSGTTHDSSITSINDNPYDKHMIDLVQLEEMMLDLRRKLHMYSEANSKGNSRLTRISSIELDELHNDNDTNAHNEYEKYEGLTPHFQLKSPSFTTSSTDITSHMIIPS